MARKTDQQKIEKFFKGVQKQIVATAGITASSYAKNASKSVMEEWANILARNIEMGFISPALAKSTEENRKARGNKSFPALLETGSFVEYIEFRWTSIPSKNYDLLEVGVWDDSALIGHDASITPYKLGLMNEYGFNGAFVGEDGKTRTVDVPARPHFRESALDIGYELNRIVRDTNKQMQMAQGRHRGSIRSRGLSGNQLVDLALTAPDRYSGSGPDEVSVGKFIADGSGKLKFKWVSGNAANSG